MSFRVVVDNLLMEELWLNNLYLYDHVYLYSLPSKDTRGRQMQFHYSWNFALFKHIATKEEMNVKLEC